jgi:hypothetical protein
VLFIFKKSSKNYKFEQDIIDKKGVLTMVEKEKLTEILKFRCTENEKNIIKEKSQQAKYFHLSDYLRRQAVYGNVLQLNEEWYGNIMRQVSGMANNLNQITRHINETNIVYSSDVLDLKKITYNLRLHIEIIEEAVEKLYGVHQNKTDTRDALQGVGLHNEL